MLFSLVGFYSCSFLNFSLVLITKPIFYIFYYYNNDKSYPCVRAPVIFMHSKCLSNTRWTPNIYNTHTEREREIDRKRNYVHSKQHKVLKISIQSQIFIPVDYGNLYIFVMGAHFCSNFLFSVGARVLYCLFFFCAIDGKCWWVELKYCLFDPPTEKKSKPPHSLADKSEHHEFINLKENESASVATTK